MTPFETLGLSNSASVEEAKAAYRKLAMQHHPDRGGNETKFKEIQAAWAAIEGGYQAEPTRRASGFDSRGFNGPYRAPPRSTWRDQGSFNDFFDEFKAANRRGMDPWDFNEVVANVSIREAFLGFSLIVPGNKNQGMASVTIPAGTPDGYRGKYTNTHGQSTTVVTRINSGEFSLRGFGDQDNLFSAGISIGDLEISLDVDALDLITGAWIQTKDFLGETLSVRVPEGFSPLQRLKVAGKGYMGWLQEFGRPSTNRMNLFIRLNPKFNRLADVEPAKLQALRSRLNFMAEDAPAPSA